MLRNQLWPGSAEEVWDLTDTSIKGFATMTRLMSLVMHLIQILAPKSKGDPSRVYLDLWCRDMGQGLVQITDEQECTYAAGYTSTRALRTWQGHMQTLVDLNFIRTKQKGNQEFAHVLLRNPLLVCAELHEAGEVPDEWWTAFVTRALEIKAVIPTASAKDSKTKDKPKLRVKSG